MLGIGVPTRLDMIKELEKGALDRMSGFVDYSFYETLHEE